MPTVVTAGVLRLMKYGSRAQLEALAKLWRKQEGFDNEALLLGTIEKVANGPGEGLQGEARDRGGGARRVHGAGASVHVRRRVGRVSSVLRESDGGVCAPAGEVQHQGGWSGMPSCQGGGRREDCGVQASFGDGEISLPNEAVTYDVANSLGCELDDKGTA